MFCQNCGSQLQPNAKFCEHCGASVTATTPTQPAPTPVGTGIMHGFNKGLTSAILGTVGFVFVLLGYIFAVVGANGIADPYYAAPAEFLELGVVFLILGAVPSILAVVFGIQSIKLFVAVRKAKSGKAPIPAFICGIGGLSFGAFGVLYVFLCIFLLGAVLSL